MNNPFTRKCPSCESLRGVVQQLMDLCDRQQKLLMDYHGERFIRNIVRKARASDLDQTLVVLGSHSREVYEEIRSFQVESVFDKVGSKSDIAILL